LPADYTFIAADKGVHRFTAALTLKTVGSKSVTATDKATASIHGTQSGIVVTPAAARTFTVSVAANPTVAGAAHSVTVTALDADGNVATGYTGTIHFTSSDAQAVLPGDYTFSAGDSGSHKFTGALTLKTAGARSVTVTDIAHSSIKGSRTITVYSRCGQDAERFDRRQPLSGWHRPQRDGQSPRCLWQRRHRLCRHHPLHQFRRCGRSVLATTRSSRARTGLTSSPMGSPSTPPAANGSRRRYRPFPRSRAL